MKPIFPIFKIAVLGAALALVGCGGGDDEPARVSQIRTLGDSLADAGTFGLRFTIQGPGSLNYADRVSQAYGFTPACNFFTFTGTTFTTSANVACSNFAVGGGVINGAGSGLTAADPRNLIVQMRASNLSGLYTGRELVVIDGGGNDAATLVGAYLGAPRDSGAAYAKVLGTQLSPAQVTAAVGGGAAGLAGAGGTYMKALADTFATQIQTELIDKGAARVAVLNVPNIVLTPRFQAVLSGVAAASGGGTAGATARAQAQGLFTSWVVAFNTQLAERFAGNANVVVVDFDKNFSNWVTNPASAGFTNSKDTACPITGLGSDGLPSYTFATCTETALAAAPPAGATGGANWYKTWMFSDGFHPTPYAHQLAGTVITDALKAKGWLQ